MAMRVAVLGGCGGIGRSLVAALLAQGDAVAVLDLPVSIDRHPPPAGVVALPVDGSDAVSVAAAFEALGRHWNGLDGFVNLAGFMIGMDTIARTIISPSELPVGIITALIGAPFFLWLLRARKRDIWGW